VQHNAYSVDGVEYGDSQTVTESFWDFGAKVSYIFRLTSIINLEVNVGVKNIFDSYQDDLDIGAGRDSAYVYGPSLPRTFFFGVKLYM
jgi:outer membrane receptor for ferrienterochelin and colicins